MSRAVLLPTPGDPFLLKYWLEDFSKYYKSEVDKLYVCLNTPIEKEVVEYEQRLLDKYGANYIYIDHQIEHGDGIKTLLDMVTEDYLMLVEDDAFVFKTGFVDQCFQLVESGQTDCVGSKRGSCAFEILEEAKKIWGIDYEGAGDQGCNFWPCFFFCKTETLRNTDQHFKAKAWGKGTKIEYLNDYEMKETGYGDTFVNTSLQLRYQGKKFVYVPQYHGSPEDLKHYENKQYLWDGKSPWVHCGSLSSGVGGVLVDDQGRPLATRILGISRIFILPQAHIDEWARRIQWWQTFYDNSDPNEIIEFREEYRKSLDRLYQESKVHRKTVLRRQLAYRELGL